jgi:glycosyltransferase involved in cell wall biosynthesis
MLAGCLDSLFAQTRTNLEFIVVDSATTDDSLAEAKQRHSDRLRLLPNTKNGDLRRQPAGGRFTY